MTLASIQDWWQLLDTPEQIFWLMAVGASALLVIQTALSFIGLDFDTDTDFDADLSADFSVFSFKSVMAFVAFFGWMGIVGYGREWPMLMIILAGIGSGLVAMFIVAYMLFQFQKIESSGTMRIGDALLKEGEVYLLVPGNSMGKGKVTLEISGTVREMRAMTEGAAIPTGSKVKVIDILEDNVLLVEPTALLEPGKTL